MTLLIQALWIVKRAEDELRELIGTALKSSCYGDIAELAAIAETLSNARSGYMVDDSINGPALRSPSDSSAAIRQRPRHRIARITASHRDQYPLFRIEDEKLVKVAWSKKDRREYEHRATRLAVWCFAAALRNGRHIGNAFQIDDVMPTCYPDGNEIPSYQSYLALAWFRELGIVESRGKDGYALVSVLSDEVLESVWHNLKENNSGLERSLA